MSSNKIRYLFSSIIFLFFGASTLSAQSHFSFENPKDTKDKVRFQRVKNLIILPMTVNGVELSFLLDTGVEKTILFSLEDRDSLQLNDAVPITLRGLGEGGNIQAYQSKHNRASIGKAVCKNLSLYFIFDKTRNISPQLGVPVHGIIGYDFFKDFVVEVDYEKEFLRFFEPSEYDEKCRNCESTPLYFHKNNPYVKAGISLPNAIINTTLLIDTGASDALWLFPGEKIEVPENNFADFLGLGLSGHIYGKRSKIPLFSLGSFDFKNITTAFPDSTALGGFKEEILKNGLIGAEILRRFDLVIDYPNQRLLFRPNHYFDDPFHYDMSGLVVRYSGTQMIKAYRDTSDEKAGNAIRLDSENNFERTPLKVFYTFVQQMEISVIRPESPAGNAGLKEGDILLRINGKKSHTYTLIELEELFTSEEGKRIKIEVMRNGKKMTKKFRLQKIL